MKQSTTPIWITTDQAKNIRDALDKDVADSAAVAVAGAGDMAAATAGDMATVVEVEAVEIDMIAGSPQNR